MALGVVCKLVSKETMQPLLPLVMDLLKHSQALVRKKTVMCLHRFLLIDNRCLDQYNEQVRRIICDKDPSVMAASLNLFYELCKENPVPYKDLIPSFVSILKQVTEARLPRDYDYHRIPAPWVQLKILEILGLLGAADKRNSEGMYSILHEVMKRADVGINVGYAIVYECVRTVTAIYPDKALLEDASLSISRFITSENHNLKYLGVNSLASIVQIDPKYATEHQLTVIDCLEDPDETLRRKTLDLLYRMTNGTNVKLVVEKLLISLEQTTDTYLKSELASRINTLAEKFAPDNEWYVTTMTQVFEQAGTLAKHEWAHNLLRLIAERAEDQDEGGEESEDIRVYAVEAYLELLESKKVLPDLLVQVIAWVMGEYGRLSISATPDEITTHLLNMLGKAYEDDSTRAWLMSALEKMVGSNKPLPALSPAVQTQISSFQKSANLDLQQRAHEFLELAKNPQSMATVLPQDKFLDSELDVDDKLGFLDGYVNAALSAGAKPYMSREKLAEMLSSEEKNLISHRKKETQELKFDAYEMAVVEPNTVSTTEDVVFPRSDSGTQNDDGANQEPTLDGTLASKAGPWGPTGYSGETKLPTSSGNSMGVAHPAGADAVPAVAAAAGPWSQESAGGSRASSAEDDLAQLQAAAVNTASHIHNTLYNPQAAGPYVPKADDRLAQKKEYDSKMLNIFSQPQQDKPKAKSLLERRKEAAAKKKAGGGGGGGGSPKKQPPAATVAPAAGNAGAETAPAQQMPAGSLSNPIQPQRPMPAPAAQPAAAASSNDDDILGMAFGGSDAGGSAPVPQEDLFGGAFAGAAAAPAPAVVSQPASKQAGDPLLDDLLDFGSPAQAPAPVSVAAVDLFGNVAAPGSPVKTGLAAIDPTMTKNLEALANGPLPSTDAPLMSDNTLHTSFIPIVTQDRTVGVLMVTNKTASEQKLRLQLNPQGCPASSLMLAYDGQPKPQVGANNTIDLTVGPRKTAVLLMMVQAKLVGAASLNGIAADVHSSAGSSKFVVPFSLLHLLRPMQINTQQFSGYWKSCRHEQKATVAGVKSTSAAFMQKVQTAMRLYAVQTIGQENIAAGKLVGLNNVVCLVHANVSNGLVIIHSQDPAFSTALMAVCQSVFRA
eukprot:g3864.t1